MAKARVVTCETGLTKDQHNYCSYPPTDNHTAGRRDRPLQYLSGRHKRHHNRSQTHLGFSSGPELFLHLPQMGMGSLQEGQGHYFVPLHLNGRNRKAIQLRIDTCSNDALSAVGILSILLQVIYIDYIPNVTFYCI